MFEKIKNFLFKNTNSKQTVAKNTVWLSISNFGGRLVKAALIIYAARVLGTAGYGIFSYAVTLAGFLGIFTDPGINSVLIRDGARGTTEEQNEVFSATIALKVALMTLSVFIIIFIGPHFSTLPGATLLLPVAALILTFDAIREFLSSLLRSREKMQWDAGIFIFTNFIIVIFGFIFILRSPTALALGWGYAIGTMAGSLLAIAVVWKDIKAALTQFSMRLAGPIIQAAWPFAVTGALGILFTNTDILIISWMKTAADVGIYSAAIRIIQVLYIIPGIIQMSTLPLFSRLAKKDDAKFRIAIEKTLGIIFLVSLPIAVGGIILGTQIMTLIFGSAFTGGSAAFKLLLITLVFDYPGSIIANAIFAYSRQKSLIWGSVVGGIMNVVLDLLLIPRFGMTGSAFGTLLTQIVVNGYLWYTMKKINYFEVISKLKKVVAASVIMGVTTTALFFIGTNVIENIVLSGAIYFLALKLFREQAISEIITIAGSGAA